MDSQSRTDGGRCPECGGRLRNGVFCRLCAEECCSWLCYLRHIANHARMRASAPSGPGVRQAGSEPGEMEGTETRPGSGSRA
jgi:hypothetical protein